MNNLFFLFLILVCSYTLAQQVDYVDFKTAKANFEIKPLNREVEGQIEFTFKILKDIDSIYINAQNLLHSKTTLNNYNYNHEYNGKHIIIKHSFKENTQHNLHVSWVANPKKALYFIGWDNEGDPKQIWTQGQGKYTSNWLPSFDDINEKVEFDLSITFENGYEVIANGILVDIEVGETKTKWHYNMDQPMSSYLVAFAVGKYNKIVEISKSGIPLEMYYYPMDSIKVEPTYRFTKQIFDFLEEEIGIGYPWQNFKQVPVKDFLYSGMENTSLTIFSDSFAIDSIAFIDRNYVNVNAHELAHQWFGNLVTKTSGSHHWLQEGFATYYALLAERDVFGDDYYYWRLYEYAQELLKQDQKGQSTLLLDPSSSSTTFYKKGAWALHMLRDQVGGEAFKKAVINYLEKHKFKNVETHDFIREVERASGQDLNGFVKIWLESKSPPYNDMEEFLILKSMVLKQYIAKDCSIDELSCLKDLSSNISDEVKIKIIVQNKKLINKETFYNNIKVRQAIAKNLTRIPSELKEDYTLLLNDRSYTTIEFALYNLWFNFPDERNKYLNKTKDIQGFNDKNIRILWLSLALITEDFEQENKKAYFDELTGYTGPEYGFEIRRNAFQYLIQIQACNEVCAKNLEQAIKHHNWKFSKFAKAVKEQISK